MATKGIADIYLLNVTINDLMSRHNDLTRGYIWKVDIAHIWHGFEDDMPEYLPSRIKTSPPSPVVVGVWRSSSNDLNTWIFIIFT